jgi:hypothetical protein
MITLVMTGAVGLMGMDASYLPLLWLYSVCAMAVSGTGALTLLAAFGTPAGGHFVLCRDGGADGRCHHPLKVLPVCYRLPAEFEPRRHITGGIRSILYSAQGPGTRPGLG